MKRVCRWAGVGALVLASIVAAAPARAADDQGAAQAAAEKDHVCTTCHDSTSPKKIYSMYQTRHGVKADSRAPLCQNCHGQSDVHIKDPGKPPEVVFTAKSKNISPAAVRSESCLKCHDSKVLPRQFWSGSQHETRGVACTDCHNIHAPDQKVLMKATQADVCFTCHKAQRAQIHRISSHPLAITGASTAPQMACSDCHNPHGSPGPTLLKKQTVNETCYTCHAEKRGPFLWEHAPVFDNCTNCHTPHGSVNGALLKERSPWLCQNCHSGDHGNQVNSGANLANGAVTTVNGLLQPGAAAPRVQLGARACLNCHVLIHGSNHPAGAKFQR